jgi:hypothetical protein
MGHYRRPARRHSNLERRGPGHIIKADLAKNMTESTVVLDIYLDIYIRIDTLLVTFSLTPFSSHKVLRHTESSLRTDTLLVKVLA